MVGSTEEVTPDENVTVPNVPPVADAGSDKTVNCYFLYGDYNISKK